MQNYLFPLWVALGGALGSPCRYGTTKRFAICPGFRHQATLQALRPIKLLFNPLSRAGIPHESHLPIEAA